MQRKECEVGVEAEEFNEKEMRSASTKVSVGPVSPEAKTSLGLWRMKVVPKIVRASAPKMAMPPQAKRVDFFFAFGHGERIIDEYDLSISLLLYG